MPKFKADLSVSGIEKLKKDIINYRDSLPKKCQIYAKELAEKGLDVAKIRIGQSPLGKYVSVRVDVSPERFGCKAILVATGEVKVSDEYSDFNTLLAIEFGAGIHYNPIANPNADDLGFGVGTFPGQLHAFEDGWWYWDEENQEWRYTHGVKATMPMHEADMEMIREAVALGKKIFSS